MKEWNSEKKLLLVQKLQEQKGNAQGEVIGEGAGGGFVEFQTNCSGLYLLERCNSRCWVSFHQHR